MDNSYLVPMVSALLSEGFNQEFVDIVVRMVRDSISRDIVPIPDSIYEMVVNKGTGGLYVEIYKNLQVVYQARLFDPRTAIECFLKEQEYNELYAQIDCNTRDEATALRDFTINNREEILGMFEEYDHPFNAEILLNGNYTITEEWADSWTVTPWVVG